MTEIKKFNIKNNKKTRIKESKTISRNKKLFEYILNLDSNEYSLLKKYFLWAIQKSSSKNYDEAIYYIEEILNKFSGKLPEDLEKLLNNHKIYLEYLRDIHNKIYLHQEKINNKINELAKFLQINQQTIQNDKQKFIVNHNNQNFDFSNLNKKEIENISRDLILARHYFNAKNFDKTVEILKKIKEKYGEKLPINYFESLHNYLKIMNAAIKLEEKGVNFFGDSSEAVSLYKKFKHYYDITTNSMKKAANLIKQS